MICQQKLFSTKVANLYCNLTLDVNFSPLQQILLLCHNFSPLELFDNSYLTANLSPLQSMGCQFFTPSLANVANFLNDLLLLPLRSPFFSKGCYFVTPCFSKGCKLVIYSTPVATLLSLTNVAFCHTFFRQRLPAICIFNFLYHFVTLFKQTLLFCHTSFWQRLLIICILSSQYHT